VDLAEAGKLVQLFIGSIVDTWNFLSAERYMNLITDLTLQQLS